MRESSPAAARCSPATPAICCGSAASIPCTRDCATLRDSGVAAAARAASADESSWLLACRCDAATVAGKLRAETVLNVSSTERNIQIAAAEASSVVAATAPNARRRRSAMLPEGAFSGRAAGSAGADISVSPRSR